MSQGCRPGPQIGGVAFPAGVTLRAVDGGANYYANNGFTNAVNMGLDTSFFPMGPFTGTYGSAFPNTVAHWASLGWNTGYTRFNLTDWDTAAMLANGIAAIDGGDGNSGPLVGPFGSNTIGFLTKDEPDGNNGWPDVNVPITQTANSVQNGMFWWTNFTGTHFFLNVAPGGGVLVGSPGGVINTVTTLDFLFTTPNTTTRHQDIASADIYWFSASRDAAWSGFLLDPGGAGSQMYPITSMTVDQAQRGSNYGDMIDVWRSMQVGHFPAPIFQIIETGDPFTGDPGTGASYIKASESPWAFWSAIVHGCRGICYFDHQFSGPGGRVQDFDTFFTTIQSGETQSMVTVVTNTCNLAAAMGKILNSPFALSYVTVSPAGYLFPTATLDLTNGGIEAMCKYYTGGSYANSFSGGPANFTNGFYIFATTRFSKAATFPVTATFTLNDPHAVSVDVVSESRTIAVSAGIFTDSFAAASAVHIYKVNRA